MKRRYGIISAVVILALLLGCTLALCASAEDATEATLTVTPASGTAETLSGTYDEMAEALNSKIATLGAGTAKLTLVDDAIAGQPIVLNGTGAESVVIELGGFDLNTSALPSTAITATGLASFKLNGGYAMNVDLGSIVSTSEHGLIALENVTAAEIYDVALSYAASKEIGVSVKGAGEYILRNAEIVYSAAADSEACIIGADGADLTLVGVDVDASCAKDGTTVALLAKSGTVRTERTTLVADIAYKTESGSWLTAVDTVFDAESAIFAASDVAGDVINCAGVTFKGTILGEGMTKDMVKLWYGTGSTLIEGTDPSESVTVATKFAKLDQAAADKWTLLENSSAQTIYTKIIDRGEITEEDDSLANAATAGMVACDTKTAFTIAVIQNKEFDTTSVNLAGATAKGKISLFLDFNGFTLTQKKGSHLFSANKGALLRLSIDGSDALGNRGGVKLRGFAGGLIYVNNVDISSVVSFSDIKITGTNSSGRTRIKISDGKQETSSANLLQLQDCRYYFDGVYMLYTAEEYGRGITVGSSDSSYSNYDLYYKTAATPTLISLQSSAFATLENCKFENAPAGNILTMNIPSRPAAFSTSYTSSEVTTNSYFAKNIEVIDCGRVANTCANEHNQIRISNSVISSVGTTAFDGAGTYAPVVITDCEITLKGDIALASGRVLFAEGEGKTKIFTEAASSLEGAMLDEGCMFYFDETSEGYMIIGGEDVTSVDMNKLFASGMVFQAGKPINVWGTCETEGATITVTLGEKSATTTVQGGKWFATLEAMDYAKGLTLTVKEDGKKFDTTTFTGIDIGEVWVMSGQSNSNLGAYKMEDFEEYKALADLYDNIRCFSVSASLSETPLDDPKNAEWFQVTSATVGRVDTGCGISAVGYVMATRLAVELEGNVTIALVDINYNGKAISNFISNNYDPKAASDAEHQIYNAMIAPLEGYNIKGFGWYQGEATADSGECTVDTDGHYGLNVDQLYATYTETFNKNEGNEPLELFIVQLAAYMGNPSIFRTYQQDIAARNEHYHLIGAPWSGSVLANADFNLDASDGFQYGHVHAARKSPLGIAWADSILENVYFKDKNLDIANPELEKVEIEEGSIKVTLDRDFIVMWGDEVEGFEISEDGATWYAAVGAVDGRSITLTSESVAAPKYVRYGFGKAVLELENGEKIPFAKDLATFKTDSGSYKNVVEVTITYGGKTYIIHSADSEIIRSTLPGNIVATNGHQLHVFSTAAVSSSAGEN